MSRVRDREAAAGNPSPQAVEPQAGRRNDAAKRLSGPDGERIDPRSPAEQPGEDDGLGPADEDEDEPGLPETAEPSREPGLGDDDVDETSAGGLRFPDDPPATA